MVQNDKESWSSDDTIRVLIASDIHLGHLENDDVRGEDSFIAFEEVLSLAVQYDVDLVLLGGDLFDHAKPSPSCMFKCTQIIRKYCFGDKPINIEVLSDQFENFSRSVNYEDPNLNVSYPILSIHGNHDDPVGQDSVSSLDILSITGLVNYFGRWTDYTHVRISPVLIQKGDTKLSLYGLSHIKDQRLARLFVEKKVEMDLVEDGNDWFNILVLHQNRADRGPNNFIPENVLPSFLDLVIWGHEHDSQVFATKDVKRENESFLVVQPGSTVATSLAAGEALPKHCALLQLHRKEYIVTPLPLKTVRPFIFKTVVLSEENLGEEDVNEKEKVQNFLKEKVTEAIKEAESLHSGDPKQPSLPLIRLSVFYEHEGQDFNRVRFCQNFNGLVANPKDILIMKREKKLRERKERIDDSEEVDIGGAAAEATDVESLLRAYYEAQPPERRLAVL
ncbi:jg1516, partial [Pararge aegeria aegeria]